jgi:hypothetical protein
MNCELEELWLEYKNEPVHIEDELPFEVPQIKEEKVKEVVSEPEPQVKKFYPKLTETRTQIYALHLYKKSNFKTKMMRAKEAE